MRKKLLGCSPGCLESRAGLTSCSGGVAGPEEGVGLKRAIEWGTPSIPLSPGQLLFSLLCAPSSQLHLALSTCPFRLGRGAFRMCLCGCRADPTPAAALREAVLNLLSNWSSQQ